MARRSVKIPSKHQIDKRAHEIIEASTGDGDDLLNTAQCAAWLGVSVQFLDIARHGDYGPRYVKIGHMVRYRRSAVIAWLEERTHRSTAGYVTHGGRPPIAR